MEWRKTDHHLCPEACTEVGEAHLQVHLSGRSRLSILESTYCTRRHLGFECSLHLTDMAASRNVYLQVVLEMVAEVGMDLDHLCTYRCQLMSWQVSRTAPQLGNHHLNMPMHSIGLHFDPSGYIAVVQLYPQAHPPGIVRMNHIWERKYYRQALGFELLAHHFGKEGARND